MCYAVLIIFGGVRFFKFTQIKKVILEITDFMK